MNGREGVAQRDADAREQLRISPDEHPAGSRDFDFLIGDWTVTHRRLKTRLAGSNDWEQFPGRLKVKPLLHGLGNIDENVLHAPSGRYLATSLRVFDRQAEQWSIWWMDGSRAGIDCPVVGRFAGDVGYFYADDEFEGQPIKVRFTYSNLRPNRAAWNQAFSADGGTSWEVNWTMEFFRRKADR